MFIEVGIKIGLGLGTCLGLVGAFVGAFVLPNPSSISMKNPHPSHNCCGTKSSTICVICYNWL